MTHAQLATSLGNYVARVRGALEQATRTNVIERIWKKDASLWKSEESHQKIIRNSLGWLTVATEMLAVADELRSFARSICASGEFQHVMVCGMGGSSLCPEVLRQTFGQQKGFPELLVLDSTDPDAIDKFRRQIDIDHCLFVIESKIRDHYRADCIPSLLVQRSSEGKCGAGQVVYHNYRSWFTDG